MRIRYLYARSLKAGSAYTLICMHKMSRQCERVNACTVGLYNSGRARARVRLPRSLGAPALAMMYDEAVWFW